MGEFRVVSYGDEPPKPIGDGDAAAYAVAAAAHDLDDAMQRVAQAASLAAAARGMAEIIARQSDVDMVLSAESVHLGIEAVEDNPKTKEGIMEMARLQATALRQALSAISESAQALFWATDFVVSSKYESVQTQCNVSRTRSSRALDIAEEVLAQWGQS